MGVIGRVAFSHERGTPVYTLTLHRSPETRGRGTRALLRVALASASAGVWEVVLQGLKKKRYATASASA